MDATGSQILFNVVTTIVPLVLAIAVHEWAHVAMARFLGDRTGEEMGRLTLNPLAHADPLWTVALPAYFVVMQTMAGAAFAVPFFGAGRPAPYNPLRLDRKFFGKRISMRSAEVLVAAAGPASNVVMALLTLVAAALVHHLVPGQGLDNPRALTLLMFKFVVMNIGLAIFNMIPVPPLDGSKVVAGLLPRAAADAYVSVTEKLSWGLLILLFLVGPRLLAPLQWVVIVWLAAAFF